MLWKITLTLNVDEKYGDPESWDWRTLLDLYPQESVAVNSELLEDRREVGSRTHSSYESCVTDSEGNCIRLSHRH